MALSTLRDNNAEEYAGSLSEQGHVNSFIMKGLSPYSANGELIANACDADATEIKFIHTYGMVFVVDNGTGMNKNKLIGMYNFYGENNSTRKTKGKCGVGAKLALAYLSQYKHTSRTLSKTNTGTLLVAECPWGEIFYKSQYTNMIKIRDATKEEPLYIPGNPSGDLPAVWWHCR